MVAQILNDLEGFGASREQLVDIGSEIGPRLLPYLDLARTEERPPIAVELSGQPRAFVFEGRDLKKPTLLRWIRRIAFRGDADWVGVLTPGRLDVYAATLGADEPLRVNGLASDRFLLPSLLLGEAPRQKANVRDALLTLLRRSITRARELGVTPHDALSLVGRAVFWRFLVDRDLLSGLEPHDVARGATTWPSCLDNKRSALQTFDWLDHTFNGGLLPFDSSPTKLGAAVFERVAGNIAHAADDDGQLELRLPDEWREVNFAHVPVGLLSEVYEAYAHEQHAATARAQSVFYTPRHIAEFVVEEALAGVDAAHPRILDPACGAGVFLLAAFRAVVKRDWQRSGKRPERSTLRRILNQQLVGFDINRDALRLAELGLYLTAIELDPEMSPRPLSRLRFEELRERVLHLQDEASGGSLGPVQPNFAGQFDLVVGNPPWTAHAPKAEKKKWIRDTRVVAERLSAQAAAEFDFPDTAPDLPFLFRAMEWAKPAGTIALVTHARWLFWQAEKGQRFRRHLLGALQVSGILNGAALRDTNVWPNVRHPFAVIFAINRPPPPRAAFQFISPELDRSPDSAQTQLRVDWTQARELLVDDLLERPWALKAMYRGNPIDQAVVEKIKQVGTPAGDYFRSLSVKLCNGYQVVAKSAKTPTPHFLRKLPDLRGAEPGWCVDPVVLPRVRHRAVWRPRTEAAFRAPLLLLRESVLADPRAPRASVALADVAYDERFDGISFSGVRDGEVLARYLQLVFQSSLVTHFALMTDAQFGVEREVVHAETLKQMPIVPWNELSPQLRMRAKRLSEALWAAGGGMQEAIDDFVGDTLGLSDIERDAVVDALAVSLPTAQSKGTATRNTTSDDRQRFASILCEEVSNVLGTAVVASLLEAEPESPWQFVTVSTNGKLPRAALSSADRKKTIELADQGAVSMVMIRNASTLTVGQLDRYRFWTTTRARVLASQVAERLSE